VTQKESEGRIFSKFAEVYGLGDFEVDRSIESPDIVLVYPDRRLGIELTEYFHDSVDCADGSNLKTFETKARQILQQAEALFAVGSDLKLHVSAHFGNLDHCNRQKIASNIAEYVRQYIMEGEPNESREEEWERLEHHALEGVVNMINVRSLIGGSCWAPSYGYYPLPLKSNSDEIVSSINARVRDKNKKYADYMQAANLTECWLLIHFERGPSSDTDVFETVEFPTGRIVESCFSRILLFDPWWSSRWVDVSG